MKRRLNSSDMKDETDALPSPSDALTVTSEQLSELVKSVLSRDVLSSLLSQAALAAAPKRFGNVEFGTNDESNVNAFLHQKLGKEHLSRRAGPRGTKLTYIESCKAIELANQAFGFNGWSCHILECKEEFRQQKNERWSIGFSSLVRIELKDGTSHEDVGFGQADGQPHLGAAIEQAKKASISDARKRALRLFGEYLGNSCYDREHIKDVHSNKPVPQPVAIPAPGSRPIVQNAVGTFGGPSPGPSNTTAFVNLPPQVPAQSAQPQPQQYQQHPAQPSVATPSPPQGNDGSVASRISALQAAEATRQATTMTSGVGIRSAPAATSSVRGQPDAIRRAPPMPQLTHAQPPMGSTGQTIPVQTNPTATSTPPQKPHVSTAQSSMPLQQRPPNLPPQPFMPRNAPPPSRMAEYPVIKNEPPPSRNVASEYDMNDLSLSQFDYDPCDNGPPGGPKRMRP